MNEIDFNFSKDKQLEITYKKALYTKDKIEALKMLEKAYKKSKDRAYQYDEMFLHEAIIWETHNTPEIFKTEKERVQEYIKQTKYKFPKDKQGEKRINSAYYTLLDTGFELSLIHI